MSLDNVELHLVDSVDEAFNLMRWLSTRVGSHAYIGCDTETSGLSYKRDVLRTVQVGDEDNGWTIPWHLWGGVFTEIVQKFEGRYVFHNAPFDVQLDRKSVV